MTSWWLESGLLGLGSIGLMGLLWPLQLGWRKLVGAVLLLMVLISTLYARWGSYIEWRDFAQLKRHQQQVSVLLASSEGRARLIEHLKARLAATPNQANGWILLGKLYLAQGDQLNAEQAFATANQF